MSADSSSPAPSPLPPAASLVERLAAEISLHVAEIPDRNSPDDQPEMMLVTPEELQRIVKNVLTDALAASEADARRIDWMERNLCRAGEVRNDAGQTLRLSRVWAIMGELETLRETVDAAIDAEERK